MNISNIIAIAGASGLYKVVAQIKGGYLTEGLTDKKRVPIQSAQKISKLEDISIFTSGDDMPLPEVFQKIYDKQGGKQCEINLSNDGELKSYFKEVLPDYDEEKVYASNIKKVLVWYNLLQKEGLLDKTEEAEGEEKIDIIKTTEGAKGKPSFNDLDSKHVKTEGAKVKAAGVRKTGVA